MRANILYSAVGAIGGFIAAMFGGWSDALITLIVFMSVDYITGLAVAGIFKKSKKSENGALESRAGFKERTFKCTVCYDTFKEKQYYSEKRYNTGGNY